MTAVTSVSERSGLSGPSRSACGGEAPTSFVMAHSHSAAGPSDTDLASSGIEEWKKPNCLESRRETGIQGEITGWF